MAQEDCRPMFLAAFKGNTEVVKVLLEAKADVESANKVVHTHTYFLSLSLTHTRTYSGGGGIWWRDSCCLQV